MTGVFVFLFRSTPNYDCSLAEGPTFVFVTGSARRRALNVVSDIVCDIKVQKLLKRKQSST